MAWKRRAPSRSRCRSGIATPSEPDRAGRSSEGACARSRCGAGITTPLEFARVRPSCEGACARSRYRWESRHHTSPLPYDPRANEHARARDEGRGSQPRMRPFANEPHGRVYVRHRVVRVLAHECASPMNDKARTPRLLACGPCGQASHRSRHQEVMRDACAATDGGSSVISLQLPRRRARAYRGRTYDDGCS